MATTASTELNGFYNRRRSHSRHDNYHHPYHPYRPFDHPFQGQLYLDIANAQQEQGSFCHKDYLSGNPLEKISLKEAKNEKTISQFLPPIGDALPRRDNLHKLHKTSTIKNEERSLYEDRKTDKKFSSDSPQERINHLDESEDHSDISAGKKDLLDLSLQENEEHFSIKTESEQPDPLYQHLSSRNATFLTSGINRSTPSEDLSSLIAIDNSIPGAVENFFRSEHSISSGQNEPSDKVSVTTNENLSYTTLTPLQPLPPISTVGEKYIPGNTYAAFMHQELNDASANYSKMGGMGHALPPLSNRMLLNGLTAQTRSDIQPQEALEAVNQVAAAVGLSHYNKPGVIPPNILSPPAPTSNGYDAHMFGRIDQCNDMATSFQGGHMFPHRGNGFVPPYTLQELTSTIQTSPSFDKRSRLGESATEVGKARGPNGDPLTNSTLNNYNHQSRGQQVDEVNTKEVALLITQELKRCSIPQAIFARKVLLRSQGTLSDLLRNPKPWSKLKSGRETFRKMYKWLQEPSEARINDLKAADVDGKQKNSLEKSPWDSNRQLLMKQQDYSDANSNQKSPEKACKRKEEEIGYEHTSNSTTKKPRLVFTDIQRKKLQAVFKSNKRPNKDLQNKISAELGLEVTTVSNFFMNARRRSIDKWRDDEVCYLSSKENSHSNTPNLRPSSSHHTFTYGSQHSDQVAATTDTRGVYSNAAGESLMNPLTSSPSGHLHFPAPHHLHPHNIQQQQQHLAQANQMLGHVPTTSLMHSYHNQHQMLDAPHMLSPR